MGSGGGPVGGRSRFSPEVREPAVRLVEESAGDDQSEPAPICRAAGMPGTAGLGNRRGAAATGGSEAALGAAHEGEGSN